MLLTEAKHCITVVHCITVFMRSLNEESIVGGAGEGGVAGGVKGGGAEGEVKRAGEGGNKAGVVGAPVKPACSVCGQEVVGVWAYTKELRVICQVCARKTLVPERTGKEGK